MEHYHITLRRKYHRKADQIFIYFEYNGKDHPIYNLVRSLPNRKWSANQQCWYVEFSEAAINTIHDTFKAYTIDDRDLRYTIAKRHQNNAYLLSQTQQHVIDAFSKYLNGKRYSDSTIETYTFLVADFIGYYHKSALEDLTNRSVELYIEDVYIKRKYSISKQRQFISALKVFNVFYPETGIDAVELVRPQKSRRLPSVLSKQEIIHLIRVTTNLKHRAIIAMIYSCGFRISELINLELKDIDIDRRQILIRNAKGRKDRYVIIAESFIPLLKNYLGSYMPEVYFVEGLSNAKYNSGSVRKFLKASCRRAGIVKRVTPHTLRHSYATHLLENGIDLRYIQELLGHARPETTMIYTHVAKKDLLMIKSPLDIAVKQFMASEEHYQKVSISRT